ncbi:hypothetical protein RND81_11G117900 [Saponaria officinalis]|uniref:Chromo domain-containing protein n=1 Tax=Saponaria officinalis TaxID=3572 RepID=A0AAW1HKR1_SAPOF
MADRRRTERVFYVGDWVWLKLQPYRQETVCRRVNEKLSPKYYGPFRVEDTVGKVAYKLTLPSTVQIHNVFHVSQLKAFRGVLPVAPHIPQWLQGVTTTDIIRPAAILEHRVIKRQNQAVVQYLVHWEGFPVHDASWEFANALEQQFPEIIIIIKITLLITHTNQSQSNSKSYIVHVSQPHDYTSLLHSLSSTSPNGPHPRLIYSYTHSTTGFAAHLTPTQATELDRHPAILSVVPDRAHQPQTTRTPEFLGLGLGTGPGLRPNLEYGSGVVIGVLDSGIWPNISSFNDDGYDDVPATWKGSCEVGPSFPKARAFYLGAEAAQGPINETKNSKSPLDTEGHGTHCASTAAGSVVPNVNIFNYAQGLARGMAYKARIAFKDTIAIGAFRAAQKGVVVSVAAGNAGSKDFTAVNVAPWILTIGASTIDREFRADVVLGDGRRFKGASLYDGKRLDESVFWGLVNGKDVGSELCEEGKLDALKVASKMVICERGGNARAAKGYAVRQAGGVRMILVNPVANGEELIADPHLITATAVTSTAGNQIKDYTSSNSNPTTTIDFRGTDGPVAAFSGRGPNKVTAEILKPDVVAPSVNILAGWTGFTGPTDLNVDPRRVQFNIIFGTSMACPHVSGLAALLRNAHPNWSVSAIKSALMTTSYNLDNSGKSLTDLATGNPSTPFAHGSGHVDLNKALDPGLVYDSDTNDYVDFLCSIGYNQKKISTFVKDPATINCGTRNLFSPGDLNYPSFSVVFGSGQNVVKYTRRVTNVGPSARAVYRVNVNASSNVRVSVVPERLIFRGRKPTLLYEIRFTSTATNAQSVNGTSSFGSIEWGDGSHRVRSPIAVRWVMGTQENLVASI